MLKDFFSKYKQIRNFLRFSPHLLKKLLTGNFFFLCSVLFLDKTVNFFSIAAPISQLAITCSELTMETIERGVLHRCFYVF